MMDCACQEWRRNIPWVEAAMKLICGPGPVIPFKYCPWCGKPLIETYTDSPVAGGENTTEFKHGR